MTAISRNKVKIYIANAGVNPADVDETSYIAGEIKSWSQSGGERDTESDPVFGGYVNKEKPVTQFEISMEVIPSLDEATRWSSMAYAEDSSGNGVYTSKNVSLADKAIFVTAIEDTSLSGAWGFNNCNVTNLDIEHNADDNMTGNISFKFSPTTNVGQPNFQTSKGDLSDLLAWTSLQTD